MVNSSEFAKRLQQILDFYGLSATAFSDQIDFNRSTISHLLSGRNKPSLEFVLKVLENFPEVELYWLLNGKGHFPATPKTHDTPKVVLEKKGETTNDLFHQVLPEKKAPLIEDSKKSDDIDRIVIFFKDGSYKSYQ